MKVYALVANVIAGTVAAYKGSMGLRFPGGRVEGETEVDAVKRHVRDQTGLTVTDASLLTHTEYDKERRVYLATVESFEPKDFTVTDEDGDAVPATPRFEPLTSLAADSHYREMVLATHKALVTQHPDIAAHLPFATPTPEEPNGGESGSSEPSTENVEYLAEFLVREADGVLNTSDSRDLARALFATFPGFEDLVEERATEEAEDEEGNEEDEDEEGNEEDEDEGDSGDDE